MSESNLEDRAAIHDLFTRYCCALDNGEIEAVVDCFTVDAILKSPVIDISGHDEIRAFARRFAAQRTAGTQFRHMVSNIAMTITGNRAAASAYLLVLISKDGPAARPLRVRSDQRGQRPMALLAPYRLSRPRLHARRDRSLNSAGQAADYLAAFGPASKVF